MFKYEDTSVFVSFRSGKDEVFLMLEYGDKSWVIGLKDYQAISKRRVQIAQRRGATLQKSKHLSLINAGDLRHTNSMTAGCVWKLF